MSSSRRARAARSVAVVAALALALPAGAAQKAQKTTSQPGSTTSTRAPAAAKQAAPAPAPTPAPDVAAEPEEVDGAWQVGPALGIEFGIGDWKYDAVKVRIDAQRVITRLSPVATVSFVGSFSVTHPSGTKSISVVVDPYFGTIESATLRWDANVFEVVPAARVTYAASRKVAFFADGGLGVAYTTAQTYLPSSAAGLDPALVEDGFGGVLRLGGGIVFTPSPAVRVAIEAVGLDFRFGNGPGSAFSLGASISHRL